MVPSPVIMAAQVLAQLQLMHPRRHSWHSSACEIEMLRGSLARAEPRDVCFCVRGVEPEEHQWLIFS